MNELHDNIQVQQTLAPAARAASATGSSVDLSGFEAVEIVALVGTISDGTHALTVEESDDGSTWSAVAASDLLGSFANLASNTPQRVGYIGGKRYLRVKTTVTGATNGGVYGVSVILGKPRHAPVA